MSRGTNPFEDPTASTNPFDPNHHPDLDIFQGGARTTQQHHQQQHQQQQQQQQQLYQQQQQQVPIGTNPFDSDEDDEDDPHRHLAPHQHLPSSGADEAAGGGGGVATVTTASVSAEAAAAPPPSAEASWQYLGDLPYRRIPIYQNVRWNNNNNAGSSSKDAAPFGSTTTTAATGLAQFPESLVAAATGGGGGSSSSKTLLDAREMRQWIQTSTVTLVEGCPHGGPIAAVTLPLSPHHASHPQHHQQHHHQSSKQSSSKQQQQQSAARFSSTQVRILSNSGQLLATIPFPQKLETDNSSSNNKNGSNSPVPSGNSTVGGGSQGPQQQQQQQQSQAQQSQAQSQATPSKQQQQQGQQQQQQQQGQQAQAPPPPPQQKFQRSASDIFKIGFTEGGILVVLMRDSLCLTYDIQGQPVLPPFFLLTTAVSGGGGSGSHGSGQVMRAHIFGHGVACLTHNKQVAVVEFLHETRDAAYLQGAHVMAREVRAASSHHNNHISGASPLPDPAAGPSYSVASALMVALITPLTAATEWAASHFKSFRTVAVLPRYCTSHGRPEVFLSTDDHSVVVIPVSATMELVDVDCRHRLASPIVDMSFCPNGRFLACFTEASMLTVMSTTFETKVLDFDTSEGSSSPPLAMQWCGEDSVVLHWKNMGILMVGPYGDWLRFPYNNTTAVHLIPEMDACRVITDSTVELLQRVPPMTANLLRIGSIEGSALLLEASDAFGAGNVSDDVLLTDNPPKEEDIGVCIEAATKEFDIATQKRLLRAASYGMQYLKQKQASNGNEGVVMGGPLGLNGSGHDGTVTTTHHHDRHQSTGFATSNGEIVLPSYTTRQFVAAARKLRILNALRNPQVGFILTVAQYDTLSPTGVLARLIAMQRPALASRLAVYLRLPKAVQLYARASKAAAYVQKVHTTGASGEAAPSDTVTAEKAIAIIQNETQDEDEEDDNNNGDVSNSNNRPNSGGNSSNIIAKNKNNSSMYRGAYATVAMAATKAGRPGVANLLLLLESSVSDKVPALISNGSYVDAMAVATLARDGDYIFSTLLQLEKACMATAANPSEISKAQSTFWQTVIAKLPPEAFHTLRRYYLATKGGAATAGEGGNSAVNLLLRAQRFTDAGATLAKRALMEEDPREQHGILHESSRVFGLGKETAFYKTCTDEYMELLKDLDVLRTKYGSSEVAPPSTSVTATLISVLHYAATHVREQHRLLSDADKIAKKFRIPERRLWHIKVKAFSESGQWSNLRILADSRSKSPIGYAPFARAAIRGKQPAAEISKYIDKIAAAEERCDLLSEAGMWKRALDEAIRIRDLQRILNVKTRCNSPELQMKAEQAIGKLT